MPAIPLPALQACLRRCRQLGIPTTRHILTVSVARQSVALFEQSGRETRRLLANPHPGPLPSDGRWGILGCFNSDGTVVDSRTWLSALQGYESASSYRCSTSRFGIGQIEGSNCTPLGLHRISEKIGGGWPAGAVFKSRKMIGFTWQGMPDAKITSRILWLDGLEHGFNRGGEVDSHARYIYIHGTGDETTLGRPASCGCIHLAADDLIPLYDKLPVGTLVWISER